MAITVPTLYVVMHYQRKTYLSEHTIRAMWERYYYSCSAHLTVYEVLVDLERAEKFSLHGTICMVSDADFGMWPYTEPK